MTAAAAALATVPAIVERHLRGVGSEADATDDALVDAIGREDQAAMAVVYRRLAPAVHGTALRVLGDRSRAEEVTQAVFLALWQQPDRYDPTRGSLKALLVSMAHRRAIDVLRSDSSRQRREERHGRADRPSTSDVVGDHVCTDDRAAALRAALQSLDPDERQAIELAYFGGRTYREVSRELDVPEGTIKSRIRRGMERLRRALAPKDDR